MPSGRAAVVTSTDKSMPAAPADSGGCGDSDADAPQLSRMLDKLLAANPEAILCSPSGVISPSWAIQDPQLALGALHPDRVSTTSTHHLKWASAKLLALPAHAGICPPPPRRTGTRSCLETWSLCFCSHTKASSDDRPCAMEPSEAETKMRFQSVSRAPRSWMLAFSWLCLVAQGCHGNANDSVFEAVVPSSATILSVISDDNETKARQILEVSLALPSGVFLDGLHTPERNTSILFWKGNVPRLVTTPQQTVFFREDGSVCLYGESPGIRFIAKGGEADLVERTRAEYIDFHTAMTDSGYCGPQTK